MPPELIGDVMSLCCFLASFRNQLGLRAAHVSFRSLDRALAAGRRRG